ncbi:YhzD family protein [Heyndrickxia ginsengihumi]|uniref:YhzD family protein n=1 Tax=Heyndrickxia ginsengihumi TaxID=363870 RepID=UPI0004709203|nr:YhzD family protein [Heyndrickxia ginsengihumi]
MPIYYLTAFESSGEKIIDEQIDAVNDQEAKLKGEEILLKKGGCEKSHRLTSSQGALILFHR